jgi:CRISPR/Cas system CSM-associated protein Csm5 (group 7 of RAMP superfamily)
MDNKTKRLINNYIHSNDFYTLLGNVDLLDELVDYSKQRKAEVVYRKCLQNHKYKLANKIKIKYNLKDKHDDMVTAFGFALMALNGR